MSSRKNATRQQPRGRRRKPEILVFAENLHDADSIKVLLESLRPDLVQATNVMVQRDPISLTRDAKMDAVKSWMQKIADTVAVRSRVAEVLGVLVHQDSDGPEQPSLQALKAALNSKFGDLAKPVMPVQEIEAWWFIYPDCLRAIRPVAWRSVKMPNGVNVDLIDDPKEDLIRRTRSASTKNPYSEADSLAVAKEMAMALSNGQKPQNQSPSWNRFCTMSQGM